MTNPLISDNRIFPVGGSCSCGETKYSLHKAPMFVHCCHCTWCQRETGSAFALNALVESSNLILEEGEVEVTEMPSNSGAGQQIVRCKACSSALWSHYGAARELVAFLRVGTLDNPNICPPDIHIFTSTKQAWVNLEGVVPVMEEYYQHGQTSDGHDNR